MCALQLHRYRITYSIIDLSINGQNCHVSLKVIIKQFKCKRYWFLFCVTVVNDVGNFIHDLTSLSQCGQVYQSSNWRSNLCVHWFPMQYKLIRYIYYTVYSDVTINISASANNLLLFKTNIPIIADLTR